METEKTIEEQVEERLARVRENIARGNELPEVEMETALTYRVGVDAEVAVHHATGLKLLEYAQSMTISTLEESKLAVSDLASIATCKKAMEAKRKEKLAPHKEQVDAIQATYKELMAPVLEAESILKNKQLVFLNEQKRIQAEQERINQQRYEAAQSEMALKGELSESVNEIEVIEAPKTVHGAIGNSGLVDHWTFEVIDLLEVPREYLIVDQAMLSMIARKYHDQKPVKGIRFINKPYLATRG